MTAPEPPVGEPGLCRSCGEGIVWTVTKAGKRMPVNPDGISHFATCPQAAEWRNQNRKGKR